MGRIFLSYSREDRPSAEALARVLEGAGHEVWWDRHIDTGSQFSKAIELALEAADLVVVAWSRGASESPWVRDEAGIARDTGRLLPITIDSSPPPIGFRQFQTLDLARWRGAKKDPRTLELLQAVDRRLNGAGTAAAPRATTVNRHRTSSFFSKAALAWAAAAAMLLIAAGAAILFFRAERAEAAVAVAVLPFSDLSPTHDKAYLAEGIGEQILSSLGTVPKLRVIGRTSAMAIGPDPDPRKLRSAFGITHVVEGSARTFANDLRVDVRLIRTADGSEVWTHEYRGSLNDIFRIQDDVAKSVVEQLNLTLLPQAHQISEAHRTSVGSYDMYLAARALQHQRTAPKLEEARRIAQDLIQKDPGYAPGHALFAELTYMLSDVANGYGDAPIAKARPVAIAEARKAISLAPRASEGYAALGLAFLDAPNPQSLAALEKAIQFDPSRAELHLWLGLATDSLGRSDNAAEQYREASELEPLWATPLGFWTGTLAASNRAPEALQLIDQFKRRGGAPPGAWRLEGNVRLSSGDFSGAVAAWQQTLAADPNAPDADIFLARTLRFLGFRPAPKLIYRVPAQHLRDLMNGDEPAMRTDVMANPTSIWTANGQIEVVRSLGKSNDWQIVVRLYDSQPPEMLSLCATPRYFIPTLIWALQKGGRQAEANRLMDCFQRYVGNQLRMTYRSTGDWTGELEQLQASLLALRGDSHAIDWLNRAIDRGWAGQLFSPNLHDWRDFDTLWRDPRMNAVQQRINAIYMRERSETIRELRQG